MLHFKNPLTWTVCVLVLLFGELAQAATVALAWDPPSDSTTTGYLVRYGTQSGIYTEQDVGLITYFTADGLTLGTNYYFVVLAYNSDGQVSNPSAEVSAVASGSGGPTTLVPGTPSAPTGFSATLRESRFIDLRWTAPPESGLVGYRISAGSAPGLQNIGSYTIGLTATVTAANLPHGTYYARVQAINNVGVGAPSNEAVFTVGSAPGGPGAPRSLQATVTGDALSMSWQPPADGLPVTGYVIEAGSASGEANIVSIQTSSSSFSTSGVPEGTYFLRVKARRAGVVGSASNEVIAVVTGAPLACDASASIPRSVSATVTGTLIQLSWQPGGGPAPTRYVVEAGSAPGGRDITTLNFPPSTTTVGGAVANGTYFLRVIAVNACGASGPSREVSVTVGGPAPVLPGAPKRLVESVAGSSVSLEWVQPTTGGAPNRYIIEATDGNGNAIVTLDTGSVTTSFAHGGVPRGTYVVRVRAANAAGIGPPSSSVTVVVQP